MLPKEAWVFTHWRPWKWTARSPIRFSLDSDEKITAVGELAWKDESGKAGGLRFTELPAEVRERLRIWATESNPNLKARTVDIVVQPTATAEIVATSSTGSTGLAHNPGNQKSAAQQLLNTLGAYGTKTGTAVADEPAVQSTQPATRPAARPPVQPEVKAEAAIANPDFLERVAPVPVLASATRAVVAAAVRAASVVAVPPSANSANSAALPPAKIIARSRLAPNPLLYSLRAPIYSAPFYTLSMFPAPARSEAETKGIALLLIAARKAVRVARHPAIVIGLTITLAFVVSMGIFAYVSTTWAGDMLFHLGLEFRSLFSSQPGPPDRSLPASRLPDSSAAPRQ